MMVKHVGILRGITLKCTAKTTGSVSTQPFQQKCCKHLRLLKLGLRVTDCLRIIKEDVPSVCLDCTCRHRRNQSFEITLFSTTSDWGLFTVMNK